MFCAPPALTTSVAGTVPESTRAIEWIGAVCPARPFRSRASSSWRSKVTAATATLGCISVPRLVLGVADGTAAGSGVGLGLRLRWFFRCHGNLAQPQDIRNLFPELFQAHRSVA